MLSIVEKVILLQNIDVFSEVPTEQLASLAAIAEEVEFIKGDIIYKEHDPSDALYLVLEGKVHLHRGDQEISVAEKEDAFGTWALFDEEPRVVTSTVVEDSRLLRVDREDFIDLLADHVQIAQGVIKIVVKRLRNLVERVA
ncbi:MAG: cyclic nucleotide-binding domain-containing protein [Aliifodinibius sp.]|nr:cyclic nucleotide-binding domain-containing protein [candidate division Zixibacteria bacterium]NIT59982.1 cyclic nucleotide-binding domain-containing protein [Fodinibius sp.]NIW42224.1 cyclic nucleotide-binding domain-containing protein [candidate division Zixibacteria bacterium]NIY28565.1 cyclic nucleotide-binding domain-containing protein [Fodinibius sp.]